MLLVISWVYGGWHTSFGGEYTDFNACRAAAIWYERHTGPLTMIETKCIEKHGEPERFPPLDYPRPK